VNGPTANFLRGQSLAFDGRTEVVPFPNFFFRHFEDLLSFSLSAQACAPFSRCPLRGENSLRQRKRHRQYRGPSTSELLRWAKQFLRSG
jgi:hypothetical protein